MAGYFDGDGSVTIIVWKFTLAFYLDWADQSREQLDQIVRFLRIQGIRTGSVRKASNSEAFVLRISERESVVKIAERMLPFCFKKKAELITLLDYWKLDLISGSEAQKRFQWLVNEGLRERHGKRPFSTMPWSYTVGFHLSRKNTALLAHKKHPGLSQPQKQDARERHNVFGESISALSKIYGVSRSCVWRALKGGSDVRLQT